MIDERERYERAFQQFQMPEPAWDRLVDRRDRKRRHKRITAGVVGIAVFVAAVWLVTGGAFDRAQTPAASGPTGPANPTTTAPEVAPPVYPDATDRWYKRPTTAPWYKPTARSEVDFVIDLNTGEMTPLPGSIIASGGNWFRYAASSDGSMLAFVGIGEEGSPQIFIAGIDGTGVRQVTHDPTRATSPAWSPDGTLIAYEGHSYAETGLRALYVLDVATGEATQITDGYEPTFTPDGRSLVYTGGSGQGRTELRTVPLAGGESMPLFEADPGGGDASMSPDGSHVTFLAGGLLESGGHCGPCRFVANADGTERRVIVGFEGTPAGTWSPDSSRIVTMEARGMLPPPFPNVIVVTGVTKDAATIVANGQAAIWLDNHTLLVGV